MSYELFGWAPGERASINLRRFGYYFFFSQRVVLARTYALMLLTKTRSLPMSFASHSFIRQPLRLLRLPALRTGQPLRGDGHTKLVGGLLLWLCGSIFEMNGGKPKPSTPMHTPISHSVALRICQWAHTQCRNRMLKGPQSPAQVWYPSTLASK